MDDSISLTKHKSRWVYLSNQTSGIILSHSLLTLNQTHLNNKANMLIVF
jgi:hypothetical protein